MRFLATLVLGMEEGLLLNPDKARAWKLAFASIFDTATIAIHFPWLVEGMQKLPDWLMAKISPSIALLLGFYKVRRICPNWLKQQNPSLSLEDIHHIAARSCD